MRAAWEAVGRKDHGNAVVKSDFESEETTGDTQNGDGKAERLGAVKDALTLRGQPVTRITETRLPESRLAFHTLFIRAQQSLASGVLKWRKQ